jgi:lipoate synthase
MNHVYDEAEKVFNPAFRIPEFDEVTVCPACDSPNILKKWDQENGNFIMHNNQIVTRAAIFCKDCGNLSFETCAVYDVQRDLI